MFSPPPPIMVIHPFPVSSASVVAIPLVPLAKASNSNTPMGPFQITVMWGSGGEGRRSEGDSYKNDGGRHNKEDKRSKMDEGEIRKKDDAALSPVLQSASPAWMSARVLGPMSSPIQPAGIEFTSTT